MIRAIILGVMFCVISFLLIWLYPETPQQTLQSNTHISNKAQSSNPKPFEPEKINKTDNLHKSKISSSEASLTHTEPALRPIQQEAQSLLEQEPPQISAPSSPIAKLYPNVRRIWYDNNDFLHGDFNSKQATELTKKIIEVAPILFPNYELLYAKCNTLACEIDYKPVETTDFESVEWQKQSKFFLPNILNYLGFKTKNIYNMGISPNEDFLNSGPLRKHGYPEMLYSNYSRYFK